MIGFPARFELRAASGPLFGGSAALLQFFFIQIVVATIVPTRRLHFGWAVAALLHLRCVVARWRCCALYLRHRAFDTLRCLRLNDLSWSLRRCELAHAGCGGRLLDLRCGLRLWRGLRFGPGWRRHALRFRHGAVVVLRRDDCRCGVACALNGRRWG